MTARIIAICNQKGGVGKTTTTINLARAAVVAGRRVLTVDLDPQGNLTSTASAEELSEDRAGLADALSARAEDTLRDVIVPGVWDGLDVVPTVGETLGSVRDELVVASLGREVRLKKLLEEVRDDYDLILIDCPPSLDQLTINGLTAADVVAIITEPGQYSLNGLNKLLQTISTVREYFNPQLTVAGVIVNRHERTIGGRHWESELQQAATSLDLPVLTPYIPKRVAIRDAQEASCGLDEWGKPEATEAAQIYTQYLTTLEGTRA